MPLTVALGRPPLTGPLVNHLEPAPAVVAGRAALLPDRAALVCVLACGLGLVAWTWQLTGRVPPTEAAFLLLVPWSAWSLGRALLAASGADAGRAHPAPLALLTGFLALGLLLLAAGAAAPWPQGLTALVLCLLVLPAPLLLRPRPAPPLAPEAGPAAALAVGIAVLAATLWTGEQRPYTVERPDEVVYKPWVDQFLFAKHVARLGQPAGPLRHTNWDLAGTRPPFYHLASFSLPAALHSLGGQSAYDVLASLWVPLGLLLVGLAAYSLAASWWGPTAGLAALAAVMLLPDASFYGFRFSWYSFHWLLQASPGLAYGLACAALALLLVTRSTAAGRPRPALAGLFVGMLTLFYKAQVLVPLLPLLGLWIVLFYPGWTRARRGLLLAGGLALAVAGGLAADRLQFGPTLVPQVHPYAPTRHLASVIDRLPPTDSLSPLVLPALAGSNGARHPVRAVLFVTAVTAGVFILVYPLLLLAARRVRPRDRRFEPLDALPLVALLLYLACFFLLPLNERGNPDEIQHRSFVWVYFLFAAWCGGQAVALAAVRAASAARARRLTTAVAVIAAGLLVVPLALARTIPYPTSSTPRAYWYPVPRGLADCARYLGTHAAAADVVQDSEDDHFMVLGGLAEHPCYRTSHPEFDEYPIDPRRPERQARTARLQELRTAATFADAARLAAGMGLRWYVAHPDDASPWLDDPAAQPVFASHGYAVYDLVPSS